VIIVKKSKAGKKRKKASELGKVDPIEWWKHLDNRFATIEKVVIPELYASIDRVKRLCQEGLELSEELQEHFGLLEEPKSGK
jgi:hypothetical protein